jgi:hypothetical protein
MTDRKVTRLPGRKPLPRRLAVSTAALRGERELLEALKFRLADAIEDCHARDLAPLSRRLLEVQRELAEFDAVACQQAERDAAVAVGDEPFDGRI